MEGQQHSTAAFLPVWCLMLMLRFRMWGTSFSAPGIRLVLVIRDHSPRSPLSCLVLHAG